MEVAYSVGVSNRFASLMAEDDDPGDQLISPTGAPEKVEKDKPRRDFKNVKQKDNREKEQQTRKSVQDSTKQSDKPQSAGRGRGGRQDNRRNQGAPGEEREFVPRGEGRGRGGRGRPRLSSRDKENDSGFSSGERGFSRGGGERGFSGGGERGFSGGDREDRGEGRGRGPGRFRGGRGGGGGRGGAFRGKREFERRSGSDKSSVKAVEKREGGGAHNWGKQEDIHGNTSSDTIVAHHDDWPEEGEEPQPPVTSEPANEEQNGDTPEKNDEQTGEAPAAVESPAKESEEEDIQPKEMTLDEYKAMMSKSSKEIIKHDVDERKPGENVDSSQWKDTIIYERSEGEYFPGTREVIEKPKTSGRIKTTLDANFFFKDPARRGRGRSERGGRGRGGEGGRGRGRGGGGGGRGRGESRDEGMGEPRRFRGDRRDHGGRAPNVEDTQDFPNLPGPPITAVEQ